MRANWKPKTVSTYGETSGLGLVFTFAVFPASDWLQPNAAVLTQ